MHPLPLPPQKEVLTKKARPQGVRPPLAPVGPHPQACGFRQPPEGRARAGAWPEGAAPRPLRGQGGQAPAVLGLDVAQRRGPEGGAPA